VRQGRGFSLVEVLVAMVILTLGATSLIALIAAAAATHKRSVDRFHAAVLAEEIIAEVQARYSPGADVDDIEADLKADIPEVREGYRWRAILIRPGLGAEGMPQSLAAGKKLGPPRAKTGAAPAKSLRTTVRQPKKPAKEESESGGWNEDELLVRVIIEWAESGRPVTESFDTILLPRPVPAAAP